MISFVKDIIDFALIIDVLRNILDWSQLSESSSLFLTLSLRCDKFHKNISLYHFSHLSLIEHYVNMHLIWEIIILILIAAIVQM